MKRNKKTRCAAMLFTLCLVTTSIVGGTFAKYTTTGEASETARVAKFGVVIATSGSLFSDAYVEAYGNNGKGNTPTVWSEEYTTEENNKDRTITVATNSEDQGENIVAPGTKSDKGLTFGISGQPEVETKITTTIEARDIYLKKGNTFGVMVPTKQITSENISKLIGSLYTKDSEDGTYSKVEDDAEFDSDAEYYQLQNEIKVKNEDYYPVVYTLSGETEEEGEITASSTKAIAKTLIEQLSDAKMDSTNNDTTGLIKYSTKDNNKLKTFAPNTDLAEDEEGPQLGGEILTWEWEYENDDEDTMEIYDKYDTILGDMIDASKSNSNKPSYCVVAIAKGEENYKDVVYKNDYVYVNDDDDKTIDNAIASLKTEFNITLTVTQVD
jgi:hypothetical protein